MQVIIKCPDYNDGNPKCLTPHLCPLLKPLPKYVVGYLKEGTKGFAVIDNVGAVALTDLPNSQLPFPDRLAIGYITKYIRKASPKGHCYAVYVLRIITIGEQRVLDFIRANNLKKGEVVVQSNMGYAKLLIYKELKR